MKQNEQIAENPGAVLRLWRRLPVLVRALISGVFVFLFLQTGCQALMYLNLRTTPQVPWHLPTGLLFLWLGLRYFGGRWWPRRTAAARRDSLRARGLTARQWRWAILFIVVSIPFLSGFVIVFYRLTGVVVPADPDSLGNLPWWSLFPTLLMVSIVAGVSEEAGFRGYLQGPLERRYGPVFAIGLTSVLFWALHLNHPSGVARLPLLVVMSIALGALAYSARSIVPGIIAHALLDTISFFSAASGVGTDLWRTTPLSETGVDTHFVVAAVVLVASTAVMVFALRRLAALSRGRDASAPPAEPSASTQAAAPSPIPPR